MWTDKVLNPQLIKALFKDDNLSLQGIKMYEIKLRTGGNLICTIVFDLESYLKSPPAKWVSKEFDTVQMQLSFINSTIRMIDFTGDTLPGSLSIDYKDPYFQVNYLSHHNINRLSIECSWIHVDRVEGYHRVE